jgi:hypothetical protein
VLLTSPPHFPRLYAEELLRYYLATTPEKVPYIREDFLCLVPMDQPNRRLKPFQ